MEELYSVPYAVVSTCAQWDAVVAADELYLFLQNAVMIDVAAANEEMNKAVLWDLVVFEEANALSAVYQEGNQQAKVVKCIAGARSSCCSPERPFFCWTRMYTCLFLRVRQRFMKTGTIFRAAKEEIDEVKAEFGRLRQLYNDDWAKVNEG